MVVIGGAFEDVLNGAESANVFTVPYNNTALLELIKI